VNNQNPYKQSIEILKQSIQKYGADYDKLSGILEMCAGLIKEYPDERKYCFKWSGYVKQAAQALHIQTTKEEYGELYWKAMLFEAQNRVLDSYLLYLEKNREAEDKFYEPKREQFLKIEIIQALQDMLDDKLDLLTISLPPGTGKTTLSKFFISGVIGWFPKDFNLFWSHSGDIARMYYDGCLEIVTNNVEYTWNEVFPDLSVTNTNAKMGQFNVGKYKPFPSLQTTSNGAENAGKVRADKFLMLDDLIGKLEEALNKTTLEKLWSTYSVDAKQRKTTNVEGKRAKEIHIATRWSTNDVIGHLQTLYAGNERCKFIAVPDIDPETGESNFNYKYQGLDVEYFNDQALTMDDVSYRCLFKNQPVEREGLLYPEDSVERYLELPKGEPEEITGQCDHKGSGTDFMFMFAAYKYGDWYYIEDVVCNRNPDYEIQYQDLTNLIVRNEMQNAFFESNQGGDRVSLEVDKRVQAQGHICNIKAIPTETNKEARIYQYANWIKQHCKFKDKSKYSAKSDYAVMMRQLFTYSVSGKNANDDIPDGLAIFAKNKAQRQSRKARIMPSPI